LRAADAGVLVRRALADPEIADALRTASAVDVIAAGKAARPMLEACAIACRVPLRRVTTATAPEAGHPLPTAGSVAAARRAVDLARAADPDALLVVLISGGASAMMALPVDGVTLEDKQQTVRLLLMRGADIHQLNTVRKHLSAIKGGQLAAASRARVVTLAVSDVIGDDLSMIASGPTVPDATTFHAALQVLDGHGGRVEYPGAVVEHLERGAAGLVAETPKPGDSRLLHSAARVIGNRFTAVDGARTTAEGLGYQVRMIEEPIVGEARDAALPLIDAARALIDAARARTDAARTFTVRDRVCVLASGETTVRVTGSGKGGRNQELALAMLPHLGAIGGAAVAASVGTDGIDGPTDAAGALVDSTTATRAAEAGLVARTYLNDNNSYVFFEALGDLIQTGPTGTNVGDLQIILTR
jgi:glycerate 2-kinase